MSLGLSRQSSKTGETLTKMGESRTTAGVFNNHAMIHYLDQRHVKKLKSNVRKKKMDIDENDNYQDAYVRIRENSKGICFQQRKENECGFFSTVSVLISLIKKHNGSCDDKFLEYLLSRSLIKSLTQSGSGISGSKLCELMNDNFFQGKKILTFGDKDIKGDIPRITMMLIGKHWMGYLPEEEIMLEPFTAEIFHLKKEHAHLAFDTALESQDGKDHSLYVNEDKLLAFYTSFLRKPKIKKKLKRTLSKIPESNPLLPRLRRGDDDSFIMPREDYGFAKRSKKKHKKGKRSTKVASTIKRAAKNSLKKARNVLSNTRSKKTDKQKHKHKQNRKRYKKNKN